jgi:WD40 repeat protein
VKVWDVASGREILAIDHPPGILERVVFSPDGLRLATSGWDGTVKLWDAESGLEILGLHSHAGRVWGVAFSPDGGSLVSAAADGTVVIWDANPADRKTRSAGTIVGG